jgi:phage terminase large subunit GpA-like protein
MQEDRLEVEVVGWGLGEESWSVDYKVLWGDPVRGDVWDDLDIYLDSTFLHESGAQLGISSACLDTGGNGGMTQSAYEYVRSRRGRRLFAIKGDGGWGKPIVNTTPSRRRTGKGARPVDLFRVGVDEAKVVVARRFALTSEGPGYCHFPSDRDPEWFAMATAERLQARMHRGFTVKEWHKTRPRNEALDCRVYAYAALKIMNPNLKRLVDRLNVEAETDEKTDRDTVETAADATKRRRRSGKAPVDKAHSAVDDAPKAPRKRRKIRRSSTGWSATKW